MEFPSSGSLTPLTVDEFDTTRHLAHAAKQASERGFDKITIVVDGVLKFVAHKPSGQTACGAESGPGDWKLSTIGCSFQSDNSGRRIEVQIDAGSYDVAPY